MAYWMNENGKRISKSFTVSKYGFDEAKQSAIQAREEAISLLSHYRDA